MATCYVYQTIIVTIIIFLSYFLVFFQKKIKRMLSIRQSIFYSHLCFILFLMIILFTYLLSIIYNLSIYIHAYIYDKKFLKQNWYIYKYITIFFNIIKYLVLEGLWFLFGILSFPWFRGSVVGMEICERGTGKSYQVMY